MPIRPRARSLDRCPPQCPLARRLVLQLTDWKQVTPLPEGAGPPQELRRANVQDFNLGAGGRVFTRRKIGRRPKVLPIISAK